MANEILNLILTKLEKIDSIEQKIDSIEHRMDSIEHRMDSMEQKMDSIEHRMDSMEQKMDSMEQKMDSMEQKMDSLELHIENVTDRNIQTVAEGHLDISRKLNDALKVEDQKEMLIIKVRVLEDEVRKIKAQLSQMP